MLRPSKVVFVAGEPLRFRHADLADETELQKHLVRVRDIVVRLVDQAAMLRSRRIDESRVERVLHRVTNARDVAWQRRDGR